MSDFMKEIHKGVEWLNTTRPGWLDLIDLNILDMENCKKCILGQVFSEEASQLTNWNSFNKNGYKYAEIKLELTHPEDFGFWTGSFDDKFNIPLKSQWLKVIKELKARELQTV